MSLRKQAMPLRTRGRPLTAAKEEAELQSSDTEESVPDTTNDKVEDQRTSGSESEIATLLRELALVREELAQLKQQSSVSVPPEQPLQPTETSPTNSRQFQLVNPYLENSLSPAQAYGSKRRRSEKTPDIKELRDGCEPTFRQWQASIQDRLEINSDYYRTERQRMALVWGHTTGLAKEYLEPRYLSETSTERFRDAEEMVELLKSYFITGNEVAESRATFDQLQMQDESFPTFKARFLSAAIKGQVPQSEWCHYLWIKITPSIRIPNLGFKHLWRNSFENMVEHLTAYDAEERWGEQANDPNRHP